MRNTTYDIDLSFFPLAVSDFYFLIFRRALDAVEQNLPGVWRLPLAEHDQSDRKSSIEKQRFEVALTARAGFEPYRCHSWAEPDLTLQILFSALKNRCVEDFAGEVIISSKPFLRLIDFVLVHREEGDEIVWLRPYALKATGEFGFLTDYSFRAKDNARPNKRTLELSLSQKAGRPNRDFYADHHEKLRLFLRLYSEKLTRLSLHDESQVQLSFTLRTLRATTLSERVYLLRNEVEVPSPFRGLQQHQPLKPASQNARFVFLFRDEDRRRSQELFRGLRGEVFPTFRGMETVFRTRIDKSNTSGMTVPGFSHKELETVARKLKESYPEQQVIPIAIVPFSKHKSPEDTAGYYTAKHAFLQQGLASQFVDRSRFDDRDSLKWAISNIGLAIFAKMGGYPWKVKPTTRRGLIIGIGQAHRRIDEKIQRYFAYSVLTDSSGIYERICVLGASPNRNDYLESLKLNLKNILLNHCDQFDSFVVHVTFSIQRDELHAIQNLFTELTSSTGKEKEFAALKYNDRNDFFGYSRATNSKVPFESSVVRLSSTDYLVWFDGLNQQNPIVGRRPERPVHVRLLFPMKGITDDTLYRYLQDAVNIAGANWRGFNGKSMPVSVYYAKLIAEYYGRFQELGLSDIKLEEITPWFL